MGREFIVPEGDCGGEWLGYKELVRCKDCRNWNEFDIHSTIVPNVRKCMVMNLYTDPDQFCKYGERRDDD